MSFKVWLLKVFQLYGYKTRKRWRDSNKENFTEFCDGTSFLHSIIVGKGTYGKLHVYNDCEKRKLHLGSFCSIANDVHFILGLDHSLNYISTYPFRQMYNLEGKNTLEATSKGNIIIDDDVWIGYGATILSGVHIHQGAVIAAGAVVVADVPAYSVVGGVPARVKKQRFAPEIIDYLLTLDYSKLTEDMIKKHNRALYLEIADLTLDEMKKLFDWFPKREIRVEINE